MSTTVSFSESSSCFRECNMQAATNLLRNRRTTSQPTAPSEDYEAILNEGMERLTFDEIQREHEVLHGVADENDLAENTINDLLSSLQEHLNQVKTGTAYETAERRDQAYACNRELQLAFLRANRFDPGEAAEKIINLFKTKLELFGDECLARDITKQDLDADDLSFLLEGYIQCSSFRDRSGRLIFMEFPGVRSMAPIRTMLRARFYVWANSVSTLVELSQGCVMVVYLVGQYQDHLNGYGFVEGMTLFNIVPVTWVGNHLCTDDRLERIMVGVLSAMMPYHLRVKTRIHFGSHTECLFALAGYGITRIALPLEGPEHGMDLSHHHAWIEQRALQEQKTQSNASAVASIPQERSNGAQSGYSENDVLCLGRAVMGVGNERLQSLARLYFPAYQNGSSSDRLTIIFIIIDRIRSHGGRFLKLDDATAKPESLSLEDGTQNVWKELSPDEERTKVTQLFRNLSRKQRRSALGSSIAASTSAGTSLVVDSYRPEDVLFGQYVMNNPGNRRLRQLVFDVAEEYNRTERGKKQDIVLRLIANIRESGGRFLTYREDQKWEVVSDKTAKEKISKQFRNIRRKR